MSLRVFDGLLWRCAHEPFARPAEAPAFGITRPQCRFNPFGRRVDGRFSS
jgi:hypothetical protein